MKHKFSINVRLLLGVIAIGCIGLSGTALAQNPTMFPKPKPSSSGSPEAGTVKSKSTNNKAKGSTLSSADKAFVKDAAKGGMMEVAMGRGAEKNATDSAVKNLGARMVKDHSNANDG